MRCPLVLIGCLTATAAFAGEPAPLTGDAITQTFRGSLIELDTPLGTTIPVRFTSDGLVSGESRALAPYLGAARDRGRWWTTQEHLCVKWFRWFDAEERCLKVQVNGDKMFWREQNGETGTATLIGREHTVSAVAVPTPPPAKAPPPATAARLEVAESPPPSPVFAAASIDPQLPLPVQGKTVATPPKAQAVTTIPAPKPTRAARVLDKPRKDAVPGSERAAVRVPTKDEPEVFRVVSVQYDDVLNVRSGPSEYHTPVGAISPNGRGIRIVGACRNYWCPIEYRRTAGWVNRYYLAEDFSAGPTREARR